MASSNRATTYTIIDDEAGGGSFPVPAFVTASALRPAPLLLYASPTYRLGFSSAAPPSV
jgi:hypothetical protein